jgi:hypothetical protein
MTQFSDENNIYNGYIEPSAPPIIYADIYNNYNNLYKTKQSIVEKKINFTNIMHIVIHSKHLLNLIEIKIDNITKKIILSIIKNRPYYFVYFDCIFSEFSFIDDKINIIDVPKIVFMFKKLYKYVYNFKQRHHLYELNVPNTCKLILKFAFNTLIIDERLTIEKNKFIQFQNNIFYIFNSCVDLIENNYIKKTFFASLIRFIY